jgi:HAUS augmin-like complex subunit 1
MDVEAAKENAEVLMQRVRDVEEKIEVYEGVPPEAREVRRVMVELRGELEGWVRRRDGLFEGLVGGGR